MPIHLYLEEQNAEPVVYSDQTLQTDSFLLISPEPRYVPAKIGLDIGIQVDPDSGDLFNFDEAIGPTVRVIVSKTVEQALIEVRIETELALLAERKTAANKLQQERDRIASEIEYNSFQERIVTERLLQSQRDRVRKESDFVHKTNCQKISRKYLLSLQKSVQQSLVAKGYLYSRSQAEVTGFFVPWLAHRVTEQATLDKSLKLAIVDDVIRHALASFSKMFEEESNKANRNREEIRALEKLRFVIVNLYLRLPEMEGRLLGPVSVRNGQTIADAHAAVRVWLAQNTPDLAEESSTWPMQFSLDGIPLPYDRVILDIGLSNLTTLDLFFIQESE